MATSSTPIESPQDAVTLLAGLWEVLIGQAILFNEGVARTLGISAVDLQAFGVITRHSGPITPTEVAERTGLPPSTTTRVLARLEQSGYVVRRGSGEDRRKVLLEPVEARASEVAQHYVGRIDQLRGLIAGRTDAEVRAVISYLSELAADAPPGARGTS